MVLSQLDWLQKNLQEENVPELSLDSAIKQGAQSVSVSLFFQSTKFAEPYKARENSQSKLKLDCKSVKQNINIELSIILFKLYTTKREKV